MSSLPIQLFHTTAISAVSMGTDITSSSINVDEAYHAAVHWVYASGAAPTGSLIIQASNDNTNWFVVSTTAITDNGNTLINLPSIGYSWLRLFWDYTSGTGTLTAVVNAKR